MKENLKFNVVPFVVECVCTPSSVKYVFVRDLNGKPIDVLDKVYDDHFNFFEVLDSLVFNEHGKDEG